MAQAQVLGWISGQIQLEAETLEVPPQVLQVGIAMIEGEVVDELSLDEYLQRASYLGSENLGGYDVQVTAESLEVGAEQKDGSAEILINEARIRRSLHHACGTLGIDGDDARHSLILPIEQSDGGHGLLLGLRGPQWPSWVNARG
jgi:hypothetical protein